MDGRGRGRSLQLETAAFEERKLSEGWNGTALERLNRITLETGYKKAGYKNKSLIRPFSLEQKGILYPVSSVLTYGARNVLSYNTRHV